MMAVELLLFDSARLCLRAFHTIADLLQSLPLWSVVLERFDERTKVRQDVTY
jgi:hypothetical protein